MEQRKPLSHIASGLLIAAIVIVVSMIMMMTSGNAARPGSGWLTYLVIIAGLVFFINQYAKAMDNYVSFGDLFSYGFKTTAVYTVVFVGFLIIFSVMFPEFKDKAIEGVRMEMEKQKNYDEDKTEQALSLLRQYFWVFAIGGTMLGFVIVGAIGSLLGASIAKKRPVNPFEQQHQ